MFFRSKYTLRSNFLTVIESTVHTFKAHLVIFLSQKQFFHSPIRAYSHDVTVAILVFQNNETAAMLLYQDNPVGIELFSYEKTFFRSYKLA